MEASITLKNVSKHYKNRYALSNLSFGIEKGSTFAIIGQNGSGKSTLLKLLSSTLYTDEGKIYIKGKNINKHKEELKKVLGFLPDSSMHDNNLTGRENLKIRCDYLGYSQNNFDTIVMPLVKRFMFEDYLDYPANTYSPGIRKRLDIIQVLMKDSEILLLDEPLMGLDFNLRNIFLKYLLEMKGQKTIVVASNEFTEIQTIADRWIVLHNQCIRFDGNIEKMISHNIKFVGQVEIKKGKDHITESINTNPRVNKTINLGNSIQIICDSFFDFYKIIKKINEEDIIRISCNSVNMEELINQLLSDEGL